MARIESETDAWPTPDGITVVGPRDADTLVGGEPPPPPLPPAPPPGDRFGAGMLVGIVLLLLVAAGIAVAWFLTHRDSTQQVTTIVVTTGATTKTSVVPKIAVPRLIGLKERTAVARLKQAGLRPKEVFRPTKQGKGIVVSQTPQEATRLAKGSRVTLVIDRGPTKVAVPRLVGEPLGTARARLERLGIDTTLTRVTSSKPAGTIVDQAPAAGTKLAKGSTVTLAVAKARPAKPATTTAPAATTTAPATTAPTTTAPATTAPTTTAAAPPQPTSATMPDVSGQTEQEAVQALNRAGILASLAFVPGSGPLGTVVGQAKSAGTTLGYHAHVQINLSTGPGDKPKEQVPDVIGKTLEDALSTVNGASLRLIFVKLPVTQRSQAGKIVQQSPLGGNQAPRNAQVLVFLGAYRG